MRLKTDNSFMSFIISSGLNLINVFALIISGFIFTSLYKTVPWYAGCGFQFLYFLLLSPIVFGGLLIISLILKRLFNLKFKTLSIMLPLISLLGTVVPVLINLGFNKVLLTIGFIITVGLFLLAIYSEFRQGQYNYQYELDDVNFELQEELSEKQRKEIRGKYRLVFIVYVFLVMLLLGILSYFFSFS